MPDYQARIESLRRLGEEGSGATEAERKLANQRADELEAKYGNRTSPSTDDTTVTSRDGTGNWTRESPFTFIIRVPYNPPPPTAEQLWQTLYDLRDRQHMWNRPPEDDEEDIVEETYRYDDNDQYDLQPEEDDNA